MSSVVVVSRVALPPAADIIDACTPESVPQSEDAHRWREIVGQLAANHLAQWDAEDQLRERAADVETVVRLKFVIDDKNARRSQLIETADDQVLADGIAVSGDLPTHSESIGTLVDRLVIAWVRTQKLGSASGHTDAGDTAQAQLALLMRSYDDLRAELAQGQRTVPIWRQLKAYGAEAR